MRWVTRFENAAWARAGALIALWFFCVSMSDASAKDANSPREILSHEFTITLPKLIGENLAWSPDARFVAVAQYGKKALYVIDVIERTISEVTLPGAVADPEITWSPDGRYLALTDLNLQPRPGAPPGIRLLTPKGEELGRVDGSTVDCWFNPKNSLAFSATSSSLWSACSYIPSRDAGKPFILAVELRVPDLKLLNVIPGDPENTELQQAAWRHWISTISGRLILTSILSSRTDEIVETTPLPPPHQPVIRYRALYRVRTVDLNSMKDVAPVLSFKSETEFYRGPNKAVYFPEIDATVIQLSPPAYSVESDEAKQKEKWSRVRVAPWLVSYSLADGKRLAAWASLADEGVGLRDIIRIKDRPLLLGSTGLDEAGRGGLRVWDPLTGKALQRMDGLPAYRLALSDDGRRLACISKNRVLFYRVAE